MEQNPGRTFVYLLVRGAVMDVIRDIALVILVSAVIIAVFYPYYSITFISSEISRLVQAVQELEQTIRKGEE